MPRLETPLGRDGPIIGVRIWIGPEHKEALKARGLQAPRPLSVPGLLDTGAQMTAIQQALAQGIGLPVHDWVRLRSSVLGAEERDAPVYLERNRFAVGKTAISLVSPRSQQLAPSGRARLLLEPRRSAVLISGLTTHGGGLGPFLAV